MYCNQLSYHPKRLVHTIIALALLFIGTHQPVSGNTGYDKSSETQKPYLVKEFTIDGAGVLKAFTVAGNIEVQRVLNSDKVRVELYVERGYAIWSHNRNLDNYRINILQRGNEVIASVEQKTRNTGFFSDKMTFSYKIYLPETMSTELKTLGGNVSLSGLRGNHMVRSNGGNLELNNVSGRVGAYTSGGNIDIGGSKGTIYAQTHGGDIHIKNSAGEMRLKTSGGNIISTQISGTYVARAEGGNVRAQFIEIGEGISMETTAGNIYVNLPSGLGLNLYATANDIEWREPDNFYGEKNRRRIDGRLNDGGIPVRLQTPAGTITIEVE